MSQKGIKYIFISAVIFAINGFVFAESATPQKPKLEDKVIGLTFKGLSKAFIAAMDLDKLKKSNIQKIADMPEEKLKIKYAKVYEALKECPALTDTYGITQNLNRGEIIKKIELLDKKQMYEIVDLVPDEFIASQFKQYLSNKSQKIQRNLTEQVKQLWSKITEKAR